MGGRASTAAPLKKNNGEGTAGYPGNPPISNGEDIQDLPWKERCFIPLALFYLSFRKSHWKERLKGLASLADRCRLGGVGGELGVGGGKEKCLLSNHPSFWDIGLANYP